MQPHRIAQTAEAAPRPRRRWPEAAALVIVLVVVLGCVPALARASARAATGKPDVSTGGVSHVRGTSVVLDGLIDPHGLLTTYYFVYGPTERYGYQTPPQTLEANNEHIKVGVPVTSFADGYHYRLVASNAGGVKLGRDKTYGKAAALKFSLPKRLAPVFYKHGFTLTGKLVGAEDERVPLELQETPYPFLDGFATVGATTQTGAGGAFSFHPEGLVESGKFRVVMKGARPIYSATLLQTVTPQVVLRVRKTAVKGLVRLYGTVTPAESGAHVLLQVDEPARPGNSERLSERTSRFVTEFSTISLRGGNGFSRFSTIVTIKHAGEYRAYVELRKGRLGSSGSETVKLVAASSKRK
jgi:hypothetical protein